MLNADPVLLTYEKGPGGYHFTYGWHIPIPNLGTAYLTEHREARWERVWNRWVRKHRSTSQPRQI